MERAIKRLRDAADDEASEFVRRRQRRKPRKLVDEVRREWGTSIRPTRRLAEMDTSTYHCRSRRADQAPLRARIQEICAIRVRYGCRRVHILLRREGWAANHKGSHTLDRESGLQLRNKTPKRRVTAKLREDRQPAANPNEVWAMDFIHDQSATGQKIRALSVVDTFSRFSPALDARIASCGEDVVRTLERVCASTGYPKAIRVDQGSEFISRDLDLWAYAKGVTLDFSRPGKPTDNAFAEAFNRRIRAECMNAHWFLNLADAREKSEAWRNDYNDVRPHGQSATRRRGRCKIPVAQPARHRDRRPETPPSGAPRSGCEPQGSGLQRQVDRIAGVTASPSAAIDPNVGRAIGSLRARADQRIAVWLEYIDGSSTGPSFIHTVRKGIGCCWANRRSGVVS